MTSRPSLRNQLRDGDADRPADRIPDARPDHRGGRRRRERAAAVRHRGVALDVVGPPPGREPVHRTTSPSNLDTSTRSELVDCGRTTRRVGAHSASSQSAIPAKRSRPAPPSGDANRAAELVGGVRDRHRMASARRHSRQLQPGRRRRPPRARGAVRRRHDRRASSSHSCPDDGSTTQLTIGLRGVAHHAQLVAEDARPDPRTQAGHQLLAEVGVGDLRPRHLDGVGRRRR